MIQRPFFTYWKGWASGGAVLSNSNRNIYVEMLQQTSLMTGGSSLSADDWLFPRDSAAAHCPPDTGLLPGQWHHSVGPFWLFFIFCVLPSSKSNREHLEMGGKGSVLMTHYPVGTTFTLTSWTDLHQAQQNQSLKWSKRMVELLKLLSL